MLIENNETFLSEMTKLFQTNQTKGGSLYITMKRLEPRDHKVKSGSKAKSESQSSSGQSENKCLIRVHNSKKKISTIVSAKDVNKFQLAYANLLKGNLIGLKKRDNKKKSPKSKATQ
ncbi:signal recognition particle 14 kDa protein-like [Oppia nitens]|uniref:signal recognition particle 14 kDa protein-like n=1 Tax=Oppia nitens TaxID=1686743 RepID=UPI0023DC5DFF|nr:signal recognition particle 14 kDa protein-like [Oppia nitens]